MPQHDLVINNASGAAVRADLNDALAALSSAMKGPNAPPAPIAGMLWLDDDTPSATVWTLKLYDGADWLSLGTFNVSTNTFTPANAVALSGGALLQALLGVAGSAGAPSYSFSDDPDTGLYLKAAGVLAVGCDGTERLTVSSAGLLSAILDARFERNNVRLRLVSQVGTPSTLITGSDSGSSFIGTDTNTRFYLMTNSVERMSVAASGAVQVGAAGLSVAGDLEVSGNLRVNSGYGSAAVAYGVRAWVNFNGTGTVAIRASGNVTSITDNGTGDYTINFTNAMPDANYAVLGTVGGVSGASVAQLVAPHHSFAPTTSSLRILTGGVDSTAQDRDRICVAIVR